MREWLAICRAPGYGKGFGPGVLQWPGFVMLPGGLPDRQLVLDLCQLVTFDYQAQAASEASVRAARYKYCLKVDRSESGCSLSFARVKPPSHPPFTKVRTQVQGPAFQVASSSFLCRTYQFRDATLSLHFAGCPAVVVEHANGQVVLCFFAVDMVLPARGELLHERLDADVEVVQESLCAYWHPISNRDQGDEERNISLWPKFGTSWPSFLLPFRTPMWISRTHSPGCM